MKKLLMLLLAFLALAVGNANAQSQYKFHYIAHGVNSNPQALCNRLLELYDMGKEANWTSIFYLANDENPIIATTADDNDDNFYEIINELQYRIKHDVNPMYDTQRILELFSANPFVDITGRQLSKYEYVDLDFFVNRDFWETGGNVDLISALYYALDADSMPTMQFTVYRANSDIFDYNRELPFGTITKGNLNNNFLFSNY